MGPPDTIVEALGDGRWTPVSGGDISRAWRFDLAHQRPLFVKHLADAPPGFFAAEASGLTLLRAANALGVPEVQAHCDDPGAAFICLDWIEAGRRHSQTDEVLGRGLAQMHATVVEHFGGDGEPAYLGSVPIDSAPAHSWPELWAEHRLRPLVRFGSDRRRISPRLAARVERVADRIDALAGPPEPPARVHGDLWSGNVIVDEWGMPWLIDPSAHGGHRETDLAMMRLFGGFGEQCYAAYQEVTPLADDWEARVPLHQMVPLLVHVILFGGSYEASLERALDALV